MADKKPEPCNVVTKDIYGNEYVVASFNNPDDAYAYAADRNDREPRRSFIVRHA